MKIVSLLFLVLFLVGCQSVSVTRLQTDVDNNWVGGGRYQVLVVCNALDSKIRAAMENKMVGLLRQEGVNASVSYNVITSMAALDQQVIHNYTGAQAPAAVMFIRIDNVLTEAKDNGSTSTQLSMAELLESTAPGAMEINLTAQIADILFVSGYNAPVLVNQTQVSMSSKQLPQAVNEYATQEILFLKESGYLRRLR